MCAAGNSRYYITGVVADKRSMLELMFSPLASCYNSLIVRALVTVVKL